MNLGHYIPFFNLLRRQTARHRARPTRSRCPAWGEVRAQFRFSKDGESAIQRLTRVWTDNFKLASVNAFSGVVIREFWSSDHIRQVINLMAETPHKSGAENRMRTTKRPKFSDCPLIAVRTQGREFFIDGRRRANLWQHQGGEFPVLVIQVSPTDATIDEAAKRPADEDSPDGISCRHRRNDYRAD